MISVSSLLRIFLSITGVEESTAKGRTRLVIDLDPGTKIFPSNGRENGERIIKKDSKIG